MQLLHSKLACRSFYFNFLKFDLQKKQFFNHKNEMADYGYTLLQKKNVILYKLPQMTTSKGHYLEEWKERIWTGMFL